jgi:hypothetical protein
MARSDEGGKNATGHGNRYLARTLGEAAVVVGRTDTFLGERYRRIARPHHHMGFAAACLANV